MAQWLAVAFSTAKGWSDFRSIKRVVELGSLLFLLLHLLLLLLLLLSFARADILRAQARAVVIHPLRSLLQRGYTRANFSVNRNCSKMVHSH